MAENSPNGYKTLREKEKLLVTSNFSFSHSVYKRLVLQTLKNQGLFGKGLRFYKYENNTRWSNQSDVALFSHAPKFGQI